MTVITPSCLLFEATSAGARPLAIPAGIEDANEAFDGLPLGIYEGLRTFDHVRLFHLKEHIERAQRSMERLGWSEQIDEAELRRALAEALAVAPWPDSRVRFDVLASPALSLGSQSRVLIALSPWHGLPKELLEHGTRSRLVRDLRRHRPLIKEAAFVVDRRRHPGGVAHDYEPIMVDEDERLLEGPSSNLFFVRDGVLRTAEAGVLEGITRAVFLQLAQELGLPLREEAVRTSELEHLDEAFLTSSVRGLVPIVEIDGRILGNGRPGALGRTLSAAYAERVEREARPA
jgi:branched-subunit amino acid aminotransferase/4-amino-4-deoxychorismate lyase